ncbi:hypothetical protein A2U01_0019151, partial [Trifolium medium]|nr:hypothetical protein [Trifolium medium]
IEKKVAVNDGKKQRGAPDPAKGCSSEEEVQYKKVEEMTFTNEAWGVKAEIVKDDKPSVDNEKQVHPETKVEIRETLAYKLEEKEEEKATMESEATKTSVKATQKHY